MTDFQALDANCHFESPTQGQKGITIWGPLATDITLSPQGGSSGTLYFTFTQPRCYQGPTQICNVTYTIHTTSGSQNNDVGPIRFIQNGTDLGYIDRFHSREAGHDLTETLELVPFGLLNETGYNSIEFVNDDPSVTVYIQGLKIIRTYQMCWLPTDNNNDCCGLCQTCEMCESCVTCESCELCVACEAEDPINEHPNEFADRYDYPCNCDGGGVSWTDFSYNDEITRIAPGQTVSWDWTNPDDEDNYVGRKSCLFNFNNVTLDENTAQTNDVRFGLKINNSPWVDFYHSKVNRHMAHSVDLATHPTLSGYYNDNPNATNTLYLQLYDNPRPKR
jgi:hypothetical protein